MSWLSDTWDDATGAVDSAGEFIEDTVESGVESLGQAADSGLDAASGLARRLGADGVADALTDLGDQVASLTGGAVDELELGQTEQPKELIRGEPAAITEATTTLNELSSSITSTGDALRTIDAAGWTGTAADGFNAVFDKQPGLWHEASDAMSAAGQSLTSWSYTVEAAQARAAEAVAMWKQAEREELAKKTAYAALSADAQAGTQLVDSWSAMKDAAREILRSARIERDGVAGQVAGALEQATATAPTEPPFTERMVANVADATDALEVAKTNFGAGLLTGLSGIVQFVRQVNPADQYNLTHPAEYGAGMSDLATGLFVAAADPGAVVSSMISDARNNPFEFAGSLTGDAILTAATAGAGGGVAAARTVERMVDAAGDFAGPGRLADTVADAGRHLPTPEVSRLESPAPVAETPRVDGPTPEVETRPAGVEDASTDRGEAPSQPVDRSPEVTDDPTRGDADSDGSFGADENHESEPGSGGHDNPGGNPASYDADIRYLDESGIEYFDENGETIQTRYLEHPAVDLVDASRFDVSNLGPNDILPGLDSKSPEVRDLAAEFHARGEVDPADLIWPDGTQYPDGFSSPSDRHPAVLEPGTQIDRFGEPRGRFVSPEGVPYHERALPPSNLDEGYHRYEVLMEVPVWAGHAAPAQGMPGGGIQYLMVHSVKELISGGYLREVG